MILLLTGALSLRHLIVAPDLNWCHLLFISMNSWITTVDWNVLNFAFSFAKFLKIWLKLVRHLDGNLTYETKSFVIELLYLTSWMSFFLVWLWRTPMEPQARPRPPSLSTKPRTTGLWPMQVLTRSVFYIIMALFVTAHNLLNSYEFEFNVKILSFSTFSVTSSRSSSYRATPSPCMATKALTTMIPCPTSGPSAPRARTRWWRCRCDTRIAKSIIPDNFSD